MRTAPYFANSLREIRTAEWRLDDVDTADPAIPGVSRPRRTPLAMSWRTTTRAVIPVVAHS
jgi:hypothetical protein